ncbi:phosphoinositide phosphatase family protein [Tripterygium wilfordii]|uniref:Phosphoinositide phosphatase family protein n=1 Tax=Tripterygium wilfordii TaxID=458696 RepID=A0A7J7CP84_TRIWF|nr:phosphoinositide phosphatase family protein [Tripterygium wilfordii]
MMERAESGQKLYTRLRLWEFPDQYVIEPTDGSSASSLVVSRADGSMSLTDEVPECSSVRVPKIRAIFGVVGLLKLVASSHLVVITDRECAGSYLGQPIFKVKSLKILPCDHSLKNSSIEQKKVENEFSALLNVLERTSGLYFSYDTNLTLSAQRLHDLGDECKLLPLWRQSDYSFVLEGTRMWRRGADPDGYVANFVETEQIFQMKGFTASFVQVRRSIPFLWEQIVDLTYKPEFEIVRHEEAPQVAERHFLDMRKKYGSVLAVDLVNKHGRRLSEKYANAMQHILSDDVRYLHFDFHQVCGHIHFERLSILYEQIVDVLKKNWYFLLNEKGEKMKEQLGVVRTNCIDCLDRTNVTQSMIGQIMLETQLRRIGVFGAEETISSHPNFDESFKILWANHGDEISIQYSGTPALKGDFVRCGQRTAQGILRDGWNALARYYLNNFRDGTKQDAIDLLHGHYIASVSRDLTPATQTGGLEAVASFPLALSLVMVGFLFATMSLRKAPNDLRHLFFSMVWASMSIGVAAVMRANGRIFCNRPRLHRPSWH